MRRITSLTAAALALLVLVACAATATASTTDTIVRDCQRSQTGYLTGTYTRAQLLTARQNLPSDVLEYSGCYDQIQQALRAIAGGGPSNGSGGGGGGGGGGTTGGGTTGGDGTSGGGTATGGGSAPPATPHVGTRQPVEIAGATVQPGTIPAIGQDAHTLPTPVIVLLVLLGLGALVPAATTLVRRVIARRRA